MKSRKMRRANIKRRLYKKRTIRNRKHKGGNGPLVTVFLMCFNEERIIDFTVGYYKRQFPQCKITICDNESTDRSVEIAKNLGCDIYSYNTDGVFSETKLTEIRNNIWKTHAHTPWVIVCDMDEILTANQNDIIAEDAKGTTILKTKGYEIYGDSTKDDLSNIKGVLDSITKGEHSPGYSKKICFNKMKIQEINFAGGSHTAEPKGDVKYSEKVYLLYHYKKLGFEYYKFTHSRSFPRARLAQSRDIHIGIHYTNNDNKMRENINTQNRAMEVIPPLKSFYLNYTATGGNISIPILIYTHSDVFDVLKIQMDYFNKLFNNTDQDIYLLCNAPYTYENETNKNTFKYKTILYDDKLPYYSRILQCIQQIDVSHFIITHENDILIKFDKDAIYKMVNIMKEKSIDSINLKHANNTVKDEPKYTPEIQVTDTLYISKMKNDDNFVFCIQPRIWNKESAIKLFSTYPDTTYRASELENIQQYMKAHQNTYITHSKNFLVGLLMDVIPEYCYLHMTISAQFWEYDKEDSKLDPILKKEHELIFNKYVINSARGYKKHFQ